MKGVGRIYQQTFIDTYSKVVCAKLYDRKTPITAADLVNDRVIPLFESHDVKLQRILTDRGSEYAVIRSGTRRPLSRGRGHRSQPHQDQEPADQRHLRALPQNRAQRILPCRVSQEGVSFDRRAAD